MNKNLELDFYFDGESPMSRNSEEKHPASPLQMPVMEVADNLDFFSTIPDGSVQLIISSPPYNVGKSYEKK